MENRQRLWGEVIPMLKKVIRFNLDDLLLYLGLEGGVFLLV